MKFYGFYPTAAEIKRRASLPEYRAEWMKYDGTVESAMRVGAFLRDRNFVNGCEWILSNEVLIVRRYGQVLWPGDSAELVERRARLSTHYKVDERRFVPGVRISGETTTRFYPYGEKEATG